MKLGQWAELKGISYKTAWRMWRDGRLPVHAEQLPTGTVVIHIPGHQIGKLKPAFQARFGITARQFNAIRVGLEGKISSIKERRPDLIAEGGSRVSKAEKVIRRLE